MTLLLFQNGQTIDLMAHEDASLMIGDGTSTDIVISTASWNALRPVVFICIYNMRNRLKVFIFVFNTCTRNEGSNVYSYICIMHM